MSGNERQLRTTFTTAAVQYADHLRRNGQPDRAITVLAPVVKVAPDDGLGWLVLGLAFADRDDLDKAASALRQAAQHAPGRAGTWVALGHVLALRGVRDEPVACFRRALACDPNHLEGLVRLSTSLLLSGDRAEAVPFLDQALALAPEHPGALAAWAQLKLQERKPDEVRTRLTWVFSTESADARLIAMAAKAATLTGSPEIARPALDRAIAAHPPRPQLLVLLHARAELCDAMGDVDEAFQSWAQANETRGTTFDPTRHTQAIDHLIARTKTFDFGALPKRFDERIVLVVGVPRSGSTLLEQALSRHPDIVACGELEALRDVALAIPCADEQDWVDALPRLTGPIVRPLLQSYISSLLDAEQKAVRYVDKMPSNLLHLGLLARIAPGARVVVMQRDPMATGFSCFRQPFGRGLGWATQLDHIGVWIREANRLLEHWRATLPLRFHTVDYDALVAEPEPTLRGVLNFLRVEFHADVLKPEAAARTAGTLSQLEVLEPIHERSRGRWRPYGHHLGPLRAALGHIDQRHPDPDQLVAG
ncbi:MAG: sulfotransferase [Myxococcota bacterium]